MQGEELIRVLSTLANPQRLRVLEALTRQGRTHVSQLARDVRLSRPLVHMHLQRLEAAGLVVGELELSDDGKARKFFEVAPFSLSLTPEVVAEAARSLDTKEESQ
jgi:DNA-binding transcriptional ArsR family regulator